MIRVTVELLPGGDEDRATEIAMMTITNQAGAEFDPTAEHGDYSVQAVCYDGAGNLMMSQRGVGIDKHPRRRYNVWGLLYAAIEALGPRGCESDPTSPPWVPPAGKKSLWKHLNTTHQRELMTEIDSFLTRHRRRQ